MLKFLNYLALLTSLAIAGIAAYFSIIGMATMFAGAYIGTVVMMSALEAGKLVTAAYLHLAWERLNYLKYYLLASVGVLMLITSLGIFGYLSKANIEVNLVGDGNNLELSILDVRIGAEEDKITRLQERLSGLDLVVTTGRPQDRNYINRQQRDERAQIAEDIDASVALITQYTEEKLPIQRRQLEQDSKIGPIKYVAEVIYGEEDVVKYLDNAVRWVIYALIFVFDPLAVLLLVSSTGMIARRAEEEKPKVVENRYVIQVPKDKMKNIRKRDLQKD
tara:strand:- start:385 stop:1215 length:831 start_codon:yes stop_codon:yes gene_type:complete